MYCEASLVAQTVKWLSTMRVTWVRSLGQEDPLEKEMAIHSSTYCLENPMDSLLLYFRLNTIILITQNAQGMKIQHLYSAAAAAASL